MRSVEAIEREISHLQQELEMAKKNENKKELTTKVKKELAALRAEIVDAESETLDVIVKGPITISLNLWHNGVDKVEYSFADCEVNNSEVETAVTKHQKKIDSYIKKCKKLAEKYQVEFNPWQSYD
jgi:acetolactate synthase small subunit